MTEFIYSKRYTPLVLTIILAILLALLNAAPKAHYRYLQDDHPIVIDEIDKDLVKGWLPNMSPVIVDDDTLSVEDEQEFIAYPLSKSFNLIVDVKDSLQSLPDNKSAIVFGSKMVYAKLSELEFSYPYYQLGTLDLTSLMQDSTDVKATLEEVLTLMMNNSKPIWFGVEAIAYIITYFLEFLIFIFILFAIGLSIKYIKKKNLDMKAIFNLVVHSSFVPVVVFSLVNTVLPTLTLYTQSLSTLTTALIALLVYRSHDYTHQKTSQ